MARPDRSAWNLEEGAEIAPGRTALKSLGGGSRYEVYLVWDDELFSLAVAKLLRPDRIEDERALAELRHEAEVLESTAHPVSSGPGDGAKGKTEEEDGGEDDDDDDDDSDSGGDDPPSADSGSVSSDADSGNSGSGSSGSGSSGSSGSGSSGSGGD